MWNRIRPGLAALLVLIAPLAAAQPLVLERIEADAERNERVARQIWDWAELGYQETRSSALLAEQLEQAGFSIHRGVADIPTAFIAEYGSGEPVIARGRH